MYATYASIALLTAVTLVFAFVAIRRSRKKFQTALYIAAGILSCGVVGAIIGLASVGANGADLVATLVIELCGITVIQFFGIRRASKKFQTVFYIGTVILACGLVGGVVRLAFVNSHAAGTLATLFMQAGGIAVSIEQTRKYKKLGLT
jgi:hypothetical protein